MLRWLWVVVLALAVLSAVYGSAATLEVNGGTIQAFTYTVAIPTSTPTDIPTRTPTPTPVNPDFTTTKVVLSPPQLVPPGLAGETVDAWVRLPKGTSAEQVDQGSLRMCVGSDPCGARSVAPTRVVIIRSGEEKPPGFEGYDVLKLTFDRQAVLGLLDDPRPGVVHFAVSGRLLIGPAPAPLVAGQPPSQQSSLPREPRYVDFVGSDQVELIAAATGTPTPTATLTPAPAATATAGPGESSPTPSATGGPSPTPTVGTPEPSPTATPTATATSVSPTATPSPSATASPPPSSTPTATVTQTASPTTIPTATPTMPPTATPT